jgi:hypothetical protein
MRVIDTIGSVDAQRHLSADLPADVSPGRVRVAVLSPTDSIEAAWTDVIAKAWSTELADANEDIYTLEDGRPIDLPQ